MRIVKRRPFLHKIIIISVFILFIDTILFADANTNLFKYDESLAKFGDMDKREIQKMIEEYLSADSLVDFNSDDNPTWQIVAVSAMTEFWQELLEEFKVSEKMDADEIFALSDGELEALYDDCSKKKITSQDEFSLLPADYQKEAMEFVESQSLKDFYDSCLLGGIVIESSRFLSLSSPSLLKPLKDLRKAYPEGCDLRFSPYDLFREYVRNTNEVV